MKSGRTWNLGRSYLSTGKAARFFVLIPMSCRTIDGSAALGFQRVHANIRLLQQHKRMARSQRQRRGRVSNLSCPTASFVVPSL
jgi:hypothetical protein